MWFQISSTTYITDISFFVYFIEQSINLLKHIKVKRPLTVREQLVY